MPESTPATRRLPPLPPAPPGCRSLVRSPWGRAREPRRSGARSASKTATTRGCARPSAPASNTAASGARSLRPSRRSASSFDPFRRFTHASKGIRLARPSGAPAPSSLRRQAPGALPAWGAGASRRARELGWPGNQGPVRAPGLGSRRARSARDRARRVPQAASRTGADTTMTRHGAPFSTRSTGSGVARFGDTASSARGAPTMISSERSEIASATIAAPKSRARTSRGTTLTPYASPEAPACSVGGEPRPRRRRTEPSAGAAQAPR